MKNAHPLYIPFQVFKILLIKIYKIQRPVLLFLTVLHEFLYHQQISIFTTFKNFIPHYQKKDFCHKFSFFNEFTQTPRPPYQSKSAMRDKSYLSTLPYYFLFTPRVKVTLTITENLDTYFPNRRCLPSRCLSVKQSSCHLNPPPNAE